MSHKTLVTLFLRGLALWMFLRALGFLVATAAISAAGSMVNSDGGLYSRSSEITANLMASGILLFGGILVFRFAPGLSRLFGAGLDAQRIEVIDAKALVAGAYAVLGIGFIAFAIPGLARDLVAWRALSDTSPVSGSAVALRADLLEGVFKVLVGAVLLIFARRLPPLQPKETSDVA